MKNIKEVFQERRSIKYFDPDKSLDDKTLKEIINMAVLAPSAFNLQPWEIIAIRSDEAKRRLYNEACSQKKVLNAPVTLAIVGDTLGYRRNNPIWDVKIESGLSENKAKSIIDNSEKNLYPTPGKKVAFAVRNSSLLAMSIMYAAKSYGVDTHPMIGFDEDKLKEIFNIDDSKTVTMLISIGYHDDSKEIKSRERRFLYDEIVKEF
ncbi:nitroreductase family protein [Sporosalibacterium faouarense]|uniref:nitroreductase family protein n=1 Tax=Sporosalibacterium faouarense TaxID=516123 RepID=UPI00141CE10E|nr:nitroreductase family protein [Sporosalibacterium faouarense]MTI49649.1 nitroreductase family protein [Bacillota bacterium]